MPNKPSAELILDTYSQEELADLYKEKVLQDSQEHIEAFKQRIVDLNQLFLSEASSTPATMKGGPKSK